MNKKSETTKFPITYAYKPKLLRTLLAIIFFCGAAWILAYAALTNDRGLIVSKIFHFTAHEATIIYWILAAVAALFPILGSIILIDNLRNKKEVILSKDGITCYQGLLNSKKCVIKYKDITKLVESNVKGVTSLNIYHKSGKAIINNTMLPKKEDLDEIFQILENKAFGNLID